MTATRNDQNHSIFTLAETAPSTHDSTTRHVAEDRPELIGRQKTCLCGTPWQDRLADLRHDHEKVVLFVLAEAEPLPNCQDSVDMYSVCHRCFAVSFAGCGSAWVCLPSELGVNGSIPQ